MTNTKIISHTFEYHAPDSLEEALRLLGNPEAMVLAGGTDLVNRLKLHTAAPASLVYIGAVDELSRFSESYAGEEGKTEGGLYIGAMVPMRRVELSSTVRERYRCLYEGLNSVGGVQIRNTATIAGNIANASPAADSPPPLIALGAECEIAFQGEDSGVTRSRIPLEDMFKGPGSTVLEQGECIAALHVPEPKGVYGTAYIRNTRVKLDVAKAGCAVFIEREGDVCREVRAVAGAVAPVPVRLLRVEEALQGRKITSARIREAAEEAVEDIKPVDDVRSSERYRKKVTRVLVRDAVAAAWLRSGADLDNKESFDKSIFSGFSYVEKGDKG